MTSHLNKKNKPTIVDINMKKKTERVATASGKVSISKISFNKIEKLKTKKAGIMGGKKTSDLIPLCHNINIENINIDITTNKKDSCLEIMAKVKNTGKTGVEMEALTAVSISCLTIYDMCKSIDKGIVIGEIKLLSKTGGKSDFFQN